MLINILTNQEFIGTKKLKLINNESKIMNSRELSRNWSCKKYKSYEFEMRNFAREYFYRKGFRVNHKYPFILDSQDDWHSNIIVPEVADYIECERKKRGGFPLHKYIHHGLSSQAMLFNLAGPLIINSNLTPLISLLSKKGIILNSDYLFAEFEYEDRNVFNEDSGQPTSIDLIVRDKKYKPVLFIESKLVEREFGGCSIYQSGDCDGRNPSADFSLCYLHFIGRKYWEKLEKYGFKTTPVGSDSSCALVNNYQYFRELLFALENEGNYILLYDERNPTFFSYNGIANRGLMEYLKDLTPTKYNDRIAYISIQELVNEIELLANDWWVKEFKKKYGI